MDITNFQNADLNIGTLGISTENLGSCGEQQVFHFTNVLGHRDLKIFLHARDNSCSGLKPRNSHDILSIVVG